MHHSAMDNELDSEGDSISVSSHKTNETTPINLLSDFLMAVMAKQYEKALQLCEEILEYEPENSTAQAFQMLIVERLALQEEQDASATEDSDNDSDSTTSSESHSEGTTWSSNPSSADSVEEEASEDEDVVVESTPDVNETHAFSSSGSESSIVTGPTKETVDELRSRVVTVKKTDGDTC